MTLRSHAAERDAADPPGSSAAARGSGSSPGAPGRRPSARRLGRSLGLLCVLMAPVTVGLALLNGRTPAEVVLGGTATVATVSVAFAVVGALLAVRRPGHPLGWLFLVAAACQGCLVLAEEYGTFALTRARPLPLGAEATWLKEWIWAPGLGLVLVFLPLLFPDGRLPSRRWWPVAWLGGVAVALSAALLAVPLWPARGAALLSAEAQYTVAPGSALLLDVVAVPLLLLASAGALASLFARSCRATGDDRAQIRWFAAAAVLTLAYVVVLTALPASGEGLLTACLAVGSLVVLPAIPVATGIAVLRYRLYDIDLVVNRTLVYGALVAVVTGGYVLAVAGVGAAVSPGGELFVSLVATGVVAVLFAPLRRRLQRTVNRLMYGERDDPYAALSRLARQVGSAPESQAVLHAVADTVARALRLPHVAVELTRGGTPEVAASVGDPVGRPLALPLQHGGELLGRLVASPRRPGESFDRAERRLLADLASSAAVAVHAVGLTADLQRSRERLVTAREEERRRLRRTLHDEVGPALSSAALKLGAVRRLLPPGSPAEPLLREVREEMRATVADVRTLAYDLRPPALDQLGLAGAVADVVDRLDADGGGLRVRVETAGPLPPLPAAVEVAAFHVTREALANAACHAGARTCRVGLGFDGPPGPRRLTVEVADDGRGLPPGFRPGIGLHGMRERVEELGGTLTVGSAPGAGTRVTAVLPCGGVVA